MLLSNNHQIRFIQNTEINQITIYFKKTKIINTIFDYIQQKKNNIINKKYYTLSNLIEIQYLYN